MENYQYAIRITREDLDGHGGVERAYTTIEKCGNEREARARHEALLDHINRPGRMTPKYERIAGSELIRRPVGGWEVVA